MLPLPKISCHRRPSIDIRNNTREITPAKRLGEAVLGARASDIFLHFMPQLISYAASCPDQCVWYSCDEASEDFRNNLLTDSRFVASHEVESRYASWDVMAYSWRRACQKYAAGAHLYLRAAIMTKHDLAADLALIRLR